jgi:hypothetical protein
METARQSAVVVSGPGVRACIRSYVTLLLPNVRDPLLATASQRERYSDAKRVVRPAPPSRDHCTDFAVNATVSGTAGFWSYIPRERCGLGSLRRAQAIRPRRRDGLVVEAHDDEQRPAEASSFGARTWTTSPPAAKSASPSTPIGLVCSAYGPSARHPFGKQARVLRPRRHREQRRRRLSLCVRCGHFVDDDVVGTIDDVSVRKREFVRHALQSTGGRIERAALEHGTARLLGPGCSATRAATDTRRGTCVRSGSRHAHVEHEIAVSRTDRSRSTSVAVECASCERVARIRRSSDSTGAVTPRSVANSL